MGLGERLRACREQKDLSLRQLARMTGIRYQTIWEIEQDQRRYITTDVAKKLARTLGVSIDYLVGTWEEQEEA